MAGRRPPGLVRLVDQPPELLELCLVHLPLLFVAQHVIPRGALRCDGPSELGAQVRDQLWVDFAAKRRLRSCHREPLFEVVNRGGQVAERRVHGGPVPVLRIQKLVPQVLDAAVLVRVGKLGVPPLPVHIIELRPEGGRLFPAAPAARTGASAIQLGPQLSELGVSLLQLGAQPLGVTLHGLERRAARR